MSDPRRIGNVTVTLRIPVDIYSQIEVVAKDYDVSISAAFRIFLKHMQARQTHQKTVTVGEANSSIPQQTQQKTVTVGEANSSVTQQTQHNIVRPDNPKQILTEQAKQKILNAWGNDDET